MTIGPSTENPGRRCTPAQGPGQWRVDCEPVSGTPPAPRRPFVERLGLAVIAALLAVLFAGVAVAAWAGGEPFLAAMGAIGCLMTAWAGGLTFLRG